MIVKNNNISIKVISHFDKYKSSPEDYMFLFSYNIKIKNNNKAKVQLLSRYWHIQDGNGDIEEIRGPGVIGLQPSIESEETFEYSSFCPLKTPFGIMKGSYQMRFLKGEVFDACIPAFFLKAINYID